MIYFLFFCWNWKQLGYYKRIVHVSLASKTNSIFHPKRNPIVSRTVGQIFERLNKDQKLSTVQLPTSSSMVNAQHNKASRDGFTEWTRRVAIPIDTLLIAPPELIADRTRPQSVNNKTITTATETSVQSAL